MGEEAAAGRWDLHVRAPRSAELAVLRDGEPVARATSDRLTHVAQGPGVWRVEAACAARAGRGRGLSPIRCTCGLESDARPWSAGRPLIARARRVLPPRRPGAARVRIPDGRDQARDRRAPVRRVSVLWSRLRDRFWALPLLCALLALGLGLGLTRLDDALDTSLELPFLFGGGPEGARALLGAIITSMISFTGLVFSITIVVLSLTSSQFSPRVLRTFLRDRFNQLALGVFVATFVYALAVLRSVRGTAQVDPFVPQLAVTVAFAFVLASIALFLGYIHHIAQSIRAATIITTIGDDTRRLLERRHLPDAGPSLRLPHPDSPAHRVAAHRPGVVLQVDDEQLASLAERHRVTVCVKRAVGEFVPAGAPLLEVYGEDVPGHERLCDAIELGSERSMDEDVGFGLRQLVDIAERALSPGVNDPSTAVQVIDQLHDILRRLATRRLSPRQRVADDGRLAVDVPEPAFADYLDLAVDEIAHWGADADRVQRRLGVMLVDLEGVARPEHRPAVVRALGRGLWRLPAVADNDSPLASDTDLR